MTNRHPTKGGDGRGGKGGKLRIILVDDHPIVRQGLAELVNGEPDLAVSGQAESAPQALKVIRQSPPDLVVMDVTLKESNGLDLIRDLKASMPEVPVLVLSMHDETFYAERAVRAGARGYIMKEEAAENVLRAIRHVLAGNVYLSERMRERMLQSLVGGQREPASPVDLLSDRELEVFRMIGRGLATRDIAEQLHLSPKTIETYRANIKQKLNLDSGADLLQHAIQWIQHEDPV